METLSTLLPRIEMSDRHLSRPSTADAFLVVDWRSVGSEAAFWSLYPQEVVEDDVEVVVDIVSDDGHS